MHSCKPPIDALEYWLEARPKAIKSYGHLLLEQKEEPTEYLINSLVDYCESAYLDARTYFHAAIGIDLHPDSEKDGAQAAYPQCLPDKAKRGIFGELFVGLVAESYELIGNHKWCVPVFLFRYHADVEAYMFALARDGTQTRQVFGRFGSDFIGVCLDEDKTLMRVMVGEAKWRKSLTKTEVDNLLLGKKMDDPKNPGKKIHSGRGIWFEVNRDSPVPHGLRQLQRLLEHYDPEGCRNTIVAMDEVLCVKNGKSIPRTDVILLIGNEPPGRTPHAPHVVWKTKPSEYVAKNDLQVVEIFLEDGESLIDAIYERIWAKEGAHA